MFLETLLCARDRLVLSYVGRDEVTGEERPPSPVVLELREILSSGYLAPGEVEKLFDGARPPLRRYADIERLDALPLARDEHTAQLLGKSLRESLPENTAAPASVEDLRRALSPSAFLAVAARLSLPAPLAPASEPTEEASKVIVTLAELRHFLEDPLQGSARFRLRLRETLGDDELADREDESFATDALDRSARLREAMSKAVLASETVPSLEAVVARYDESSLREELAGRAPAGLFREAERERHAAILNKWAEQLRSIAGGGPLHGRVLHFGRAAENEDAKTILPAISLDREAAPAASGARIPLQVELHGRTSILVEAPAQPRASVILGCRSKDADEETRRDRESLAAFLDHVALAAAGLSLGQAGHRGLLLLTDGDKQDVDEHRFAALDPARARQYLARLVRDMLTGTLGPSGEPTGLHAYVLPCEAVFRARREGTAVADEAARLREGDRTRLSTLYGPIRDAVTRWNPPPAETAARMAVDRFGLFFELLDAGAA
jgi:exodeoxyribonuclease V gamma subunit